MAFGRPLLNGVKAHTIVAPLNHVGLMPFGVKLYHFSPVHEKSLFQLFHVHGQAIYTHFLRLPQRPLDSGHK